MITVGKFVLAAGIAGAALLPSVASAADLARNFLHDHHGDGDGRPAPGPLAAAGLPALVIAGAFIYFRRRKQNASHSA